MRFSTLPGAILAGFAIVFVTSGCGMSQPPREAGLPESRFTGRSISLLVGASVRVSVVGLRLVTSDPSIAAVVEPVGRGRIDDRPSIFGVAPGVAELRLLSACFICWDRGSGVQAVQEVLFVHVVPRSLP